MSETSVEERYHESRRKPRDLRAASITGWRHRQSAASVPAPSENEILQVMYWLKAEGFGDQADVTLLERFLGVGVRLDVEHLDQLIEGGYVERVGDRYQLTAAGTRKGCLELAASIAELTKPTYGECGQNPWCTGINPGECRAGLDGDGRPGCAPVTSWPDT